MAPLLWGGVIRICRRWIPLLVGSCLFGCTNGPMPQPVWPWSYDNDFEQRQTGGFLAVSRNVAQFGEAPEPSQPVTPEAPQHEEAPVVREVKPAPKAGSGSEFVVSDLEIAPPSYLPIGTVPVSRGVTAYNHGKAPVSVTIDLDRDDSENTAADQPLPLVAVLPPGAERTLLHLTPLAQGQPYHYRYRYSWSIGDYTAQHHCPEGYRFPFGAEVGAFADVATDAAARPADRHAVIFVLPGQTPVRAARKGTVVRIKDGHQLDILHDDSTVATYGNLGIIAEGVAVGALVSAEDVIGFVGAEAKKKEGYFQLTVWRPQPKAAAAGLEILSFPIEFCDRESGRCRALTNSQWVSGEKAVKMQKQKTKRTKAAGVR